MADDDLVTAAEFGDHTQAVVVRNLLEEAGIPAFLTNEWMSQGLFEFGSAAGGVRVQVPASRLDEARRLIEGRRPEPVNWSEVDVGQPEEEGPVDEPESSAEPPGQGPAPAVVEIEPPDLTLRERRANRIVRGALIGLFAWPVLLLALWRIIQIANSDERLRPEYQRKANIGAVLVLAGLLLPLGFCCGLGIAALPGR